MRRPLRNHLERALLLAILVSVTPGCRKLIALIRGKSTSDSDWNPLASDTTGAASKPVAKTPAKLTVTWTKTEFSIPEMGVTGHADPYELGYQVMFDKLPDGTKVKLGATEGTSQYGNFLGHYDMTDKIGAQSTHDAFSYDYNLDPGDKIHVTFPDGATLEVPLPPASQRYGLEEALKKLKDGHGVLFGKEPDAAPKQHTIAYIGGLEPEVFGPGAKVTDIDWVALDNDHEPKDAGRTCSGYTGGPTSTLPLWTKDSTTVIYERKTGNVIDKKDFTASSECPMVTSGDKATAYVDPELPKAWLRDRRLR